MALPCGALSLESLVAWGTMMSLNEAQRAEAPADVTRLAVQMAGLDTALRHTPVADQPLIARYLPWIVDGAIGHPERDEMWTELAAIERVSSITTPALSIGSWYESLTSPELMTPGEIHEITVDLIATSNVFLPGHRVIVEISSSNFPRYDRNSNTGGVIAAEHEFDMVSAVNRLHRGPSHPSRITLPIIAR